MHSDREWPIKYETIYGVMQSTKSNKESKGIIYVGRISMRSIKGDYNPKLHLSLKELSQRRKVQ